MATAEAVIPQLKGGEIKSNIPEALARMAKPEMPDVKALLGQLTTEISAIKAQLRVLNPELVKQQLSPEVQARIRQGLESMSVAANDKRANRIQGARERISALRTKASEVSQPIITRAQETGKVIVGQSDKLVGYFRSKKDKLVKGVETRGYDVAATMFKSLSTGESVLGEKLGIKGLKEASTDHLLKTVGLRAHAEIMRAPLKPMPPPKL